MAVLRVQPIDLRPEYRLRGAGHCQVARAFIIGAPLAAYTTMASHHITRAKTHFFKNDSLDQVLSAEPDDSGMPCKTKSESWAPPITPWSWWLPDNAPRQPFVVLPSCL